MQGLIIAVIIITFLFNVYKNFKKEMEKAKARGQASEDVTPAKPRVEVVEKKQKPIFDAIDLKPSYQPTQQKPVVKEYTTTPVSDNNKQDYYREQAIKKELRNTKTGKKAPALDYYNPEIPALEVVENRRIHEPHKHGHTPQQRKAKHLAADFNFRQALIYDAILRRPEY